MTEIINETTIRVDGELLEGPLLVEMELEYRKHLAKESK